MVVVFCCVVFDCVVLSCVVLCLLGVFGLCVLVVLLGFVFRGLWALQCGVMGVVVWTCWSLVRWSLAVLV